MISSFNIIEGSPIYIEDCSEYKQDRNALPYSQFVKEDIQEINVLIKITLDNLNGKVLSINKDELTIPSDGWYRIVHLLIPTFNWLNLVNSEVLSSYNNIYVYSNDNFYKYVNHQLTKVSIEEILEINPNSKTTISISSQDVFNTDNLEKCMIGLNDLSYKFCEHKEDACQTDRNCKRNHTWHILNVIRRYVDCGNNVEALRLLEEFTSCINWCSTSSSSKVTNKCNCI